VLREPSDFKTLRIAFFSDPDGNVLELVEELG
jgi:predicted enzyme related to lactoylglutathione lyase